MWCDEIDSESCGTFDRSHGAYGRRISSSQSGGKALHVIKNIGTSSEFIFYFGHPNQTYSRPRYDERQVSGLDSTQPDRGLEESSKEKRKGACTKQSTLFVDLDYSLPKRLLIMIRAVSRIAVQAKAG
jgi:hypothetical protein